MDIVWGRCVRRCWQLRASTACANGSLTSSVSSNCPPHKHNSWRVMWALKETVALASIISFNPFEKCNSINACSQIDVISLFLFFVILTERGQIYSIKSCSICSSQVNLISLFLFSDFYLSRARFVQSSRAVFAELTFANLGCHCFSPSSDTSWATALADYCCHGRGVLRYCYLWRHPPLLSLSRVTYLLHSREAKVKSNKDFPGFTGFYCALCILDSCGC